MLLTFQQLPAVAALPNQDDDLDSHTAIDSLHAMSGAINEYLKTTPNKGVTLRAQRTYHSLLNALGLFEKRGGGADKLTEDLIRTLIDLRNHYRKEISYVRHLR